MKSFDQFQNESFVGNAVGIVNRVANKAAAGVKKVVAGGVKKPTTGPLVPTVKKPTPGQAARNNPAVRAAALKKQSVQNKAAQQPKKNTTVATPVTKGPFTQTTKSGNKDMPGAIVKKTPSTGRKIGDFVRKTAGAVGSAASKVGSKVNQVRQDTLPARKNIRTNVAKFAADKNVRQVGSALNQARKALPTAQDFRNSGDSSGSGFGGSFTGKTAKGVKDAFQASKKGKKFEKSSTLNTPVLGRKGMGTNTTVVRGRELSPKTGLPIEPKKEKDEADQSPAAKLSRRVKKGVKRAVDGATMTLDRKYKPDKKDDQPPEATSGAKVPNKPKTPSDRVTSGKGEERKEAQSGGKSKGTGTKSIRVGSQYVERPKKKEEPKPDPVTASKGGKSEGDTDQIRIGASGRQMRVTGGSDSVPIRRGKVGKKLGRPPKKDEKSKPDKTSPGQLSLLDGESKGKPKKIQRDYGKENRENLKKVQSTTPKNQQSEIGKSLENISPDRVAAKVSGRKEKRDASREATKSKVTTNYTKPKKGEQMKVPEKKDKVTVNTSKDTTKKRETQKKNAPAALAQAVERRSEADAAKDAVKDMRQSGEKVTDDVRSQLSKTLAKTESDPNKSTQLKGKSDEDLTRSTASSDDEGSFRRNAKRTSKKLGPKAAAKYAKYENRTPEEEEAAQQKMFNKKNTPKSLQGAERATNKEIDKLRKKDTYGKKKTVNPNASKTTGTKTVKKKLSTNKSKKKEEVSESFSHWREEFIWETDKKYPEKVKEIKPMTGKNTITINPEDETSKYKRGY